MIHRKEKVVYQFGYGEQCAYEMVVMLAIVAGRFNQEYRAAQFRGLPLPILWIAEYFTFDGEGIRWGRHYRQAGWFSHIMLWLVSYHASMNPFVHLLQIALLSLT